MHCSLPQYLLHTPEPIPLQVLANDQKPKKGCGLDLTQVICGERALHHDSRQLPLQWRLPWTPSLNQDHCLYSESSGKLFEGQAFWFNQQLMVSKFHAMLMNMHYILAVYFVHNLLIHPPSFLGMSPKV